MSARRRHRVIVGATTTVELRESLDYIEERNTGAAKDIFDKIDTCIQRISSFPESSPVDPRAPPLSAQHLDAKGRVTHAAGFTIRYAFPVRRGKDPKVVLILSIRHSRRRPLGNPEYLRRFLVELSKLRSPDPTE